MFFSLVLGTLSACSFYGIFSKADPALGLITEQTDLAADIPAAAANSFTLSVVEDYGREYVVLASDMPYNGTHLWLMDADLNVLQTFTYADLMFGGVPLSGSHAWFDAWHLAPHRMIVGNQLFTLTAADTLAWIGWAVPQGPGQQYFADHSGGDFNIAQILVTGNSLDLYTYPDTWASPSVNVTAVIGTASAYSLLAVFSDANATDAAHQAGFFVFRDMDTGTDHFVKIPWADIMNGAINAPADLLSFYELFSRPSGTEQPDLLGYADGAFFSYSRGNSGDSGDFVRFDLTGAALPDSLHYEKLPDMQVAYSLSGTHYFTFDRTTRVLSRRARWW
jgi:hypothetical protein